MCATFVLCIEFCGHTEGAGRACAISLEDWAGRKKEVTECPLRGDTQTAFKEQGELDMRAGRTRAFPGKEQEVSKPERRECGL